MPVTYCYDREHGQYGVLSALNRIIEQAMLAQATTPEGQAHRCLHDIEETARRAFQEIICSCRCHNDGAESCDCGCCPQCERMPND